MENKLSAKDLGVDLTPTCKYCGEKLNDVSIDDYKINPIASNISGTHVCNPEKVIEFRRNFHMAIKEAHKKQIEVLKLKDIDENQLRKRFNV